MRTIAAIVIAALLLAACDGLMPGGEKAKPPAVPVANPWETLSQPLPLPKFAAEGRVEHTGAKIWYARIGAGSPVLMLHGAFGNAESFGNQALALVKAGHEVILIETRGHGRSTRGDRPLHYELLESDVIAVMDALQIKSAAVVGWSDGAIQGLIMAMKHPNRLTRLFAFGANMDQTGLLPGFQTRPMFNMLMDQAQKDYARLSPTPNDFGPFSEAMLQMLSTEPNYAAKDLAAIRGPAIAIADGDHEELIKPEHTAYLARTIPGAKLIVLKRVSHFAPVQRPAEFNAAMLGFLDGH